MSRDIVSPGVNPVPVQLVLPKVAGYVLTKVLKASRVKLGENSWKGTREASSFVRRDGPPEKATLTIERKLQLASTGRRPDIASYAGR
jgi:hypothetical protein